MAPTFFMHLFVYLQYVLIKFMEARQSSAERLSINGIRFYGFNRKESFLANHTLVSNDCSALQSNVNVWNLCEN